MKKIMFSDRYGLTQAVLEGRKTMTRRIIKGNFAEVVYLGYDGVWFGRNLDGERVTLPQPKFEIGEDVAIAQAYQTLGQWPAIPGIDWEAIANIIKYQRGWTNKMFVSPNLMPHRIHFTDVRVQWLHEISNEDAMKEGVFKYDKPPLHHEYDMFAPWPPYVKPYKWDCNNLIYRCSARSAFSVLIDCVCGGCTWARNPLVYTYSFELIK